MFVFMVYINKCLKNIQQVIYCEHLDSSYENKKPQARFSVFVCSGRQIIQFVDAPVELFKAVLAI